MVDPQTVQTQALQWIGVAGAIALGVISLVKSLKAAWLADNNEKRINGHANMIDNLKTNMPPPGSLRIVAAEPVAPATDPPTAPATPAGDPPPADAADGIEGD